ncbi:MAG: hypothetical protein GY866_04935 [Proteobacteria bacterium]|nr:hypothetical protein [Pseudomonadota bacterium]
METFFWKTITRTFGISILAASLTFGACKKDEDDSTVATSSTVSNTFTESTSATLSGAILDLPDSIKGSPPPEGKMRTVSRRRTASGGGGGMAGIYSGITNYVSMADMMKMFVEEFMVGMVQSSLLQTATEGEAIEIPEDPMDPGGPRRALVERPADGSYEWKVSLYFTESGETPEFVIYFTLAGAGAKGRLIFAMTEADEDLAAVGIDLDITRAVDLTFDGTSSTKTLEVKYIGDLSNMTAYADANWSGMTTEQKDAMDLGQPEKVFLTASYDGAEYTIYATSYHSGWAKEAELSGEESFWGDTLRSMYMFKAKCVEGGVNGCKLYLALPRETTTDASNVWTDDSVGEIFTNAMLNQLNDMIAVLHDGINDPDDYCTGSSDCSTTDEQNMADGIVEWLTGLAPAGEGDYVITKTELEDFVNSTPEAGQEESFHDMYKSISYMINPAFYQEGAGFLGTYDETNLQFYEYSLGSLAESADTSSIDDLMGLDLSAIVSYVPSEVKAAEITVE